MSHIAYINIIISPPSSLIFIIATDTYLCYQDLGWTGVLRAHFIDSLFPYFSCPNPATAEQLCLHLVSNPSCPWTPASLITLRGPYYLTSRRCSRLVRPASVPVLQSLPLPLAHQRKHYHHSKCQHINIWTQSPHPPTPRAFSKSIDLGENMPLQISGFILPTPRLFISWPRSKTQKSTTALVPSCLAKSAGG